MKRALLLLLLVGCAGPQGPRVLQRPAGWHGPENDADAMLVAWRYVYGQGPKAPNVTYIGPPHLNCNNGRGWKRPIDGVCIGGVTPVPTEIWIAYPANRPPLSETAFCHELGHAYLWQTTKHPDPEHARREVWGETGLVNRCVSRLQERGL